MNDNNFNQTQVDQEEYTASSTEGGYEYSSGDPASSLFVPVLTVTLLLFTYLGYRAYAKRRDSMAFDSVSTACQDINDAFELSDMDSLHDRNDRKLTRKFKKRLKAKNKNIYMPPPAESDEDGMYVREESSNLV